MTTQTFAADWPLSRSKCSPLPLNRVEVGGFLGRYVDQNLESVLLATETALFDGFKADAGDDVPLRLAADSDVYKWLEGACYVYARTRNAKLRAAIDGVVSQILNVQSDDGYISTQVPPHKRFDSSVNHDLYIAGHFFEAAVAYTRATGEEELLSAACRWADYLISEYESGNPYFETVGEKEHSEYELGFLRLYRESGDPRYLKFAMTLAKTCRVGPNVMDVHAGDGSLHAVRFGYLMAGLADLYLETGDEEIYRHVPGIWRELVDTRSYVTGAIGSHGEILSTEPFDLPHTQDHPDRTMGETCSSIAMAMFTWRMFSIAGESGDFDVIERILYNHILGALALNGKGSFYYSPMRVVGDLTGRTDHWHVPACTRGMLPEINKTFCCMPNCWWLIGALPEYLFSKSENELYVNLYTNSSVQTTASDGSPMTFAVETDYPHNGKVIVKCTEGVGSLTVRLRIPGWCSNAEVVTPDGERVSAKSGSFFDVGREWSNEDSLTLDLPMPIRMIEPDPRVAADRGQVVFARGPFVYCLESNDLDFPVELARTTCTPDTVADTCSAKWNNDLFGGVHTITVPGADGKRTQDLTLIPWYGRANRGEDSRWIIHIPVESQ